MNIYTTLEKFVDANADVVKDAMNIGELKNVFYVRFVESLLLLHQEHVKNMLKGIMLCSSMLDRCKTFLLYKTSDWKSARAGIKCT